MNSAIIIIFIWERFIFTKEINVSVAPELRVQMLVYPRLNRVLIVSEATQKTLTGKRHACSPPYLIHAEFSDSEVDADDEIAVRHDDEVIRLLVQLVYFTILNGPDCLCGRVILRKLVVMAIHSTSK